MKVIRISLFYLLLSIVSNAEGQTDTSYSEEFKIIYDTTFESKAYEIKICISEYKTLIKERRRSWKNEYEGIPLDSVEKEFKEYIKSHFSTIKDLKAIKYFDFSKSNWETKRAVVYTFITTSKEEIVSFFKDEHPSFYQWIKAEVYNKGGIQKEIYSFINNASELAKQEVLILCKEQGADSAIFGSSYSSLGGRYYNVGRVSPIHIGYGIIEISEINVEDVNVTITVNISFRKLYFRKE